MMSNSIGNIFKITTFGESHGIGIGGVIEGCPVGFLIKKKYINKEIKKRKTGTTKFVSPRKEEDNIKIFSGLYEKRTTGTPIGFFVKNINKISKDYNNIKNLFRPGHADFAYLNKYGIRDFRGGGRSSARTTISIVIAGAIAKQILKKYFSIKIFSYVNSIGKLKINFINKKHVNIKNLFMPNKKIKKKIFSFLTNIIKMNNSVGCKISLNINGLPIGLGEPLFEKINSCIHNSISSLNAVKAIEIGKGIKSSYIYGNKNNDLFFKEGILSNNSGGILGGISTGKDINVNIYIKPTSSIFLKQKTINYKNKECKIKIKGRHDPCVGIRSIPIIESLSSIIIINLILKQKINNFY
ncbi:chorismate synthase [Candidatus Vidania fulgoroideorum]